jgi:micrococcal nuclease
VSSRTAALWILLFFVLAVVGGGLGLFDVGDGGGGEVGRLSAAGRVVDVVDGDTVKVRLPGGTETVRYIGVDTPETVKPGEPVQCFGKRASEFNDRLVAGRRVRLSFGRERRDRYGRLLAYVYLPGRERSVNALLVERGYGRVLVIPPNVEHERSYRRLERRARSEHLGLWGSCPL